MKQIKSIMQPIINIPKYILTGIQCIFSVEKQKELNMEKKIIPIIIITLSITTYLISVFIISRWYVQNKRNQIWEKGLKEETEIIKEKEKFIEEYKNLTIATHDTNYDPNLDFLNINLSLYKKQNKDTVAWIQVNGTNINYPVVQQKDNEYYLNHDFYKRKTNIGWVFGDYRDDFLDFNNNTIIYAHNLINRTMFGQLPFLLKKNWQSNPNNHYIKLSTTNTNSIWKIFSVYKIKPTVDYLQVKFNSPDTYTQFLTTIKKRSIYNFSVELNPTDKIITLSTCDDIGTGRVVVHAKLYKIENK